jgi:hypothetical protein
VARQLLFVDFARALTEPSESQANTVLNASRHRRSGRVLARAIPPRPIPRRATAPPAGVKAELDLALLGLDSSR